MKPSRRDAEGRLQVGPTRESLVARLTGVVDRTNAAIAVLDAEAPTPAQHRRPLVLGQELAAPEHALGHASEGRDAPERRGAPDA